MKRLMIGIDPGNFESGWAIVGQTTDDRLKVVNSGVDDNQLLLRQLLLNNSTHASMGAQLSIEMIASYGMPVGFEVFDTCVWIGRFVQAWHEPDRVVLCTRMAVKNHLCHSSKAKDANIRQALLDKLGPQGTKKNPGPLYGVKSHAWAAVAVAVTVLETQIQKKPGAEAPAVCPA